MTAKLKLAFKISKDKSERLYAVLAMFCAIGGGYKLTTLPAVHLRWHLPIWQFVGGILIFEVAYHLYKTTEIK